MTQDLNLPKSIITRLAKGVLPSNTQIQGNAVLAMGKSATVFINYLASQCVLPFLSPCRSLRDPRRRYALRLPSRGASRSPGEGPIES